MKRREGAAAAPEVVLRVIPMPADTAAENWISGGWVMGKLDALQAAFFR